MKIYVCLPNELYANYSSFQKSKELTDLLNKYFDSFELEFALQNVGLVKVYAMPKPKFSSFSDELKNDLVRFFSVDKSKLDLKTDYARLNPNFKPVSVSAARAKPAKEEHSRSDELDYEKLSYNYVAEEPHFSFEQVILSKQTLHKIEHAIGIIEVEHKVFDEWGLRNIIPQASTALNFYGLPGTGKTMSAEAVASKLHKKIIKATYADIESKYLGEGPKMLKAIFLAAERQDAVLFLDEADSLLSKRLTNVSQGSEQSINSLRSQLLISLESFKGVVIFASNLVINYDKAFLSRLINIEFTMPDQDERLRIWENHLFNGKVRVPLSSDVDLPCLAEKYSFCGREIKNAVKNACIAAALNQKDFVSQNDFLAACEEINLEKTKVLNSTDHTKA